MEQLLGILVLTAVCAALAWVASLLVKAQLTPLAFVGAGLFGNLLGTWLFAQLQLKDPVLANLVGVPISILATLAGAFLVLLVVKVLPSFR
jgi:uncharacterized membrane protein YeaQ/YmgE (transglycosylase-associated protein family)